jgi:hypothetical protein
MRQVITECYNELVWGFGERGAKWLTVACLSREEQAKALNMTVEEVYRLRDEVVAFCRKVKGRLGIPKGELWRAEPDPELSPLRRRINAKIPWRYRQGPVVAAIVAVTVLALGGMAYNACSRQAPPVHRETPLELRR